jgi:hypothetical protein
MNIKKMEIKKCNKCNIEKDFTNFAKCNKCKDGVNSICKLCRKEHRKIYHEQNRENIKNKQKEYYWENRDKRLLNYKKWYEKNREYVISYSTERQNNNRESVNEVRKIRHHKKYKTDILYKLKINVRNRVKSFLKVRTLKKTTNSCYDLVGCTVEQLKNYIEKQFTEGMSWDNHNHTGWHIDHIIPLSSAKTDEEVFRLCHYTNLQPLWAKDNYKKGKKIL